MKRIALTCILMAGLSLNAAAQGQNPSVISCLEIYDLASGSHTIIQEFPFLIEAPNWTPDGKWLVVNKEGRLYRIAPDGEGGLLSIDTGEVTQCNNDHVITADGKWIGLSSNDPANKGGYSSYVFLVPFEGGTPRRITPLGPSYLHGISPDGKWAAYCAFRGPDWQNMEQDIYVIPTEGGEEIRLTDAPGLDDGPEYSPDGKYIWFNSVRTGKMQVWRMKADGSEQTQMTFDPDRNSWFPHVSPDGKKAVYISYRDDEVEPGDHPANKHVQLRMIPSEGGSPVVLLDFFGGQGSLNVNSWNPESTQFAFVSYKQTSGNPLFPGWYADPEAAVLEGEYWIFPTYSDIWTDDGSKPVYPEKRTAAYSQQYNVQTFMDAFSSKDLVNWTKHPRVLTTEIIPWVEYAMWAPAVFPHNGKYYLFFSGNDIQSDEQYGGIGVAVADHPGGPYKDALGKPLIGKFVNGAQPIDQFVFRDDDGSIYMYYGGWRHCNMVRLNDKLDGLLPFEDGSLFKEVTPEGYVEGPFLFKRNGKYYFMWSEGNWTGPDYRVAYAMADSAFGPFERQGTILQEDPEVGTGAGHHSVLQIPGKDEWYIVYHRHPLGDNEGPHRVTCIDRMEFAPDGTILPVKITVEGVAPVKLD